MNRKKDFEMKRLGEISHSECKITLYSWNEKYIIKIEKGLLEQTYKVSEADIPGGEESVKNILNEVFLQKVMLRFNEMRKDLNASLEG